MEHSGIDIEEKKEPRMPVVAATTVIAAVVVVVLLLLIPESCSFVVFEGPGEESSRAARDRRRCRFDRPGGATATVRARGRLRHAHDSGGRGSGWGSAGRGEELLHRDDSERLRLFKNWYVPLARLRGLKFGR